MRAIRRGTGSAVALTAAAALVLGACAPDDGEPTTTPETGETDPDEQVLLPAGVFGERCQEILAAADLPQDLLTDGTDPEPDNGVTDEGTADGEVGTETAPGADDDGTQTDGTGTDDTGTDGTGTDGTGTDGTGFDDDTDAETEPAAFAQDEPEDGTETDTDLGTETETETDNDTATTGDVGTTEFGDEQPLRELTVLEVIEALPHLSQLHAALSGTELERFIADDTTEVTVFAPHDEAFEAFETGGTDTGVETDTDTGVDTEAGTESDDVAVTTTTDLDSVLRYHVSDEGPMFAQDLVDRGTVATLFGVELRTDTTLDTETDTDTTTDTDADTTTDTDADTTTDTDTATGTDRDGAELRVTVTGETVQVEGDDNDARVVCANIEAADGVIHVTDEVLLPPDDRGATVDGTEDGTDTDTDTETGTTGTDGDVDTDADTDADTETEVEDGTDA